MTLPPRPDIVPAPPGYRWATGGGSLIGECNGHHLARHSAARATSGTVCGRYGPDTPPDPERGRRICGSCARVANINRIAGLAGPFLTQHQQNLLTDSRVRGRVRIHSRDLKDARRLEAGGLATVTPTDHVDFYDIEPRAGAGLWPRPRP